MARLRYNGLTATLGADLLTAGTTITFTAALTSAAGSVPTIGAGDYIPLAILDTDGSVLEIMHLTAYTSGATTGTVTRAQESTAATDHLAGLSVINGPTAGDLAATNLVACKVKRVTAHTMTSAALTPIPWDGEIWDTHGFHDNATNNTRLTIPAGQAGVYHLAGSWVPGALVPSGTRCLCRVMVNGVEIGGSEIEGGGVYASPFYGTDHLLAEGDYVEFAYYIGTGTPTLNINNTRFWIRKVGTL